MLREDQLGQAIPVAETLEPRLLMTATFTDATASVGLPHTPGDVYPAAFDAQYLHSCAWGDVNGDGYPDLFYGAFGYSAYNASKPDLPSTDGIDRLFIYNPGTGQYVQSFQTSINGPASPTNYGRTSGATFADFDNDGDLDLIVSRNWRSGTNNYVNQLLRNDGNGNFTDVTAGSHVADTTMSGRNAFVFDYNGDGKLDILLQDDQFGATQHSRLMRNDTVGTTGALVFTEVTATSGIDSNEVGLGGAVGDINGDSWPDFVNVGWDSAHANPKPPEVTVYINNHDGTFHKSTTFNFSAAYPWGTTGQGWADLGEDWAAGASIGDLNGDGIMDMVLGQHYGDAHYGAKQVSVLVFLGTGNNLSGDPQWVDATTASGVAATALYSKMPTPDIQDFDNDGRMDIWTAASINDSSNVMTPYILYSSGNSGTLGGVPVPHFAAAANLDSPANSYENFPGKTFAWQPNSRDRYNARYFIGGPTTDYNHDGLLDIFTAEAFNYDHYSTVWRNTTVTTNHWFEVRVNTSGAATNRFGIDATVKVYQAGHSGDAAYLLGMGTNDIANGFTSSRPAIVHFGLGSYSGNVDVVAKMPDGGATYYANNVASNQQLTMSLKGDMNGDGLFNGFDINPFVLGLTNPAAYATQYPLVNRVAMGDINYDGLLNGFDITPFVSLLVGGGAPPAPASQGTTQTAATPVADASTSQTATTTTVGTSTSPSGGTTTPTTTLPGATNIQGPFPQPATPRRHVITHAPVGQADDAMVDILGPMPSHVLGGMPIRRI